MFKNIIVILNIIILIQLNAQAGQSEYILNINFDAKVAYILKKFQETIPPQSTITYTKVPRGIIISVAESEFFSPNSTIIKENGKFLLRSIAYVINGFNNKCTVESHTEEKLPGNSIYKEDWEISIRRATAITDFITQCCGVDPERLTPIGFGDIMPFRENVARKNFTNNRIDFVIFDYTTRR